MAILCRPSVRLRGFCRAASSQAEAPWRPPKRRIFLGILGAGGALCFYRADKVQESVVWTQFWKSEQAQRLLENELVVQAIQAKTSVSERLESIRQSRAVVAVTGSFARAKAFVSNLFKREPPPDLEKLKEEERLRQEKERAEAEEAARLKEEQAAREAELARARELINGHKGHLAHSFRPKTVAVMCAALEECGDKVEEGLRLISELPEGTDEVTEWPHPVEDAVAELSRSLAGMRLHCATWFEEHFRASLEELELEQERKLEADILEFQQAHKLKSEMEAQVLRRQRLQELEENLEKVEAEVEESMQQILATHVRDLNRAHEVAMAQELASDLPLLVGLSEKLDMVEEALQRGHAVQSQARNHTANALALGELQELVKQSSSHGAELAAACDERGIPLDDLKVPTGQMLLSGFEDIRQELIDSCFAIPGILGGGLAWLFNGLYWKDAPAWGQSAQQSNLAFFARWKHLEEAELPQFLEDLEASLSGAPRERAAAWVAEARRALILTQNFSALSARAQCLNSFFC